MPLLEIKNLTVEFKTGSGFFRAVDGVSLTVDKGEVLAIVGESGSGKTLTALALMGLLPMGWQANGSVHHDGVDLIALDEALNKLAVFDKQQARVVELRYFSGLSLDETAHALNISRATVARDWESARALLYHELKR